MTDGPKTDQRIIGTLEARDGTGVVRMEDRFATDPADLWSALTDPARLARWLGEFSGDLVVGGSFRALFFASGWEGTGRVEACDPPHSLRVVTTHTGTSEDHVIKATLTADGDETLLVLEESGMPLGLLPDYGAGIQIHVEDLAAEIAGRARDAESEARWEALRPAYERLAGELG